MMCRHHALPHDSVCTTGAHPVYLLCVTHGAVTESGHEESGAAAGPTGEAKGGPVLHVAVEECLLVCLYAMKGHRYLHDIWPSGGGGGLAKGPLSSRAGAYSTHGSLRTAGDSTPLMAPLLSTMDHNSGCSDGRSVSHVHNSQP